MPIIHPFTKKLYNALIGALGGGLAIGAMIGLAMVAGLPLLAVPFTTSIVLVMAAPDSPQAQPRNIVGGHILSALSGLTIVLLFGHNLWLAALAVGLSIALMQLTDTFHPPAGINGFLMVTAHPSWTFVFLPVSVGAILLVFFAYIYHRLTRPKSWPRSWWGRLA